MRKFEIFDRVRHCGSGNVGTIVGLDVSHNCVVRYDDDKEEVYFVDERVLEFLAPRMAFLTRLQTLLGLFDAEMASVTDDAETVPARPSRIAVSVGGEWLDYPDNEIVNSISVFNCLKEKKS